MSEIWKEIPGFSRYMVSNTGKLKSMNYKNGKREKELKPAIDGGYYRTVLLNDKGEYKTVRVHKMVLLAFMGESNLEVNHIDGDKVNNNLHNLEYCTHSENLKHAFRMGLEKPKRGMENSSAKLNDNQVKEIREYAKKHGYLKNRRDLAKKYRVSEANLKDIVSRRRNNWAHI